MKKNFGAFAAIGLILGIMISVQYKSTQNSPSYYLPDRRTEITIQTEHLQNQHDALVNEIDSLKYKLNYSDAATKAQAVKEMLDKADIATGATSVIGPGIVLTLDVPNPEPQENAEFHALQYWNLLLIVNELNAAGAESISINKERIVAGSQIGNRQTSISVNGVPIKPPFEIRAIGNARTLESSLNLKGGELQALAISGIKVDLKKSEKLEIPAYSRELTFHYAVNETISP